VSSALGPNLSGRQTRRLFHRVPYTETETAHIRELKRFALQSGKHLSCSDMQILRYLYSVDFRYAECMEKL
jgi:hypothetical protein